MPNEQSSISRLRLVNGFRKVNVSKTGELKEGDGNTLARSVPSGASEAHIIVELKGDKPGCDLSH